jgi:H/ACA ribonucleoprotein complex subunit 3
MLSKCAECGTYTMQGPPCKACGSTDVRSAYPAKFSPEDKYGKYRRQMRAQIKEKQEQDVQETE